MWCATTVFSLKKKEEIYEYSRTQCDRLIVCLSKYDKGDIKEIPDQSQIN